MKKTLFLCLLILGLLSHKTLADPAPEKHTLTHTIVIEVCDKAAGIVLVDTKGNVLPIPIKDVTKDQIEDLHKRLHLS